MSGSEKSASMRYSLTVWNESKHTSLASISTSFTLIDCSMWCFCLSSVVGSFRLDSLLLWANSLSGSFCVLAAFSFFLKKLDIPTFGFFFLPFSIGCGELSCGAFSASVAASLAPRRSFMQVPFSFQAPLFTSSKICGKSRMNSAREEVMRPASFRTATTSSVGVGSYMMFGPMQMARLPACIFVSSQYCAASYAMFNSAQNTFNDVSDML
mmetsp:Transcript_10780/g.44182  ORF Transcript_10780/g.44182 Transcript_10780/m.44182 type:complete len:211 (-) Transcript_10780:877-1509(-)